MSGILLSTWQLLFNIILTITQQGRYISTFYRQVWVLEILSQNRGVMKWESWGENQMFLMEAQSLSMAQGCSAHCALLWVDKTRMWYKWTVSENFFTEETQPGRRVSRLLLHWLNLILLIRTVLTCWKHGSFTLKLCPKVRHVKYLVRDAVWMPCVVIDLQLCRHTS